MMQTRGKAGRRPIAPKGTIIHKARVHSQVLSPDRVALSSLVMTIAIFLHCWNNVVNSYWAIRRFVGIGLAGFLYLAAFSLAVSASASWATRVR